jgi:hypothetical protein
LVYSPYFKKKSQCPESSSYLYRPKDSRLSTTDDVKDSFYEELHSAFDKHHMKILLGDFKLAVKKI